MSRLRLALTVLPAMVVLGALVVIYFISFDPPPAPPATPALSTGSDAGLAEVRAMAPANLVLDSATEVSRLEEPEGLVCEEDHCSRASIVVLYETDDADAAFAEAIATLQSQDWLPERPVEGIEATLWGWPEVGPWVADVSVTDVNGKPGLEIHILILVR